MRYPSIDLAGAVVAVTGGGRGIGKATGAAFAALGATVCLGDLDPDTAEFHVDVTARKSFAAFVAAVTARFGRIDVLVNNAGVMPLGRFLDEPDALSRTTVDVNLWGVINGMRLVLPAMTARGRGHVVNIASMAGKVPIPGMAVYNATKFAVVGLSATVRRECRDAGVSVSAVLPGVVRTGLASGVPLGRGLPAVEPAVVAQAVVRSCRTRRAEIPVPGYLGGWDLLNALLPEPLMALARRAIRDDRGLTEVDPAGRADYVDRVARQAATRKE